MRALLFVAILLLPAFSGCLLEGSTPRRVYREREFAFVSPSGIVPQQRTETQAYVVLIRGQEEWEIIEERRADPRTVCPDAPSFYIDSAKQRLRYESDYYRIDPRAAIVVAIEYDGVVIGPQGLRSGCASVQQILSFPGRAAFNVSLRHDFSLHVVVEALDGFVSVNRNYFAPMGEKVEGGLGRIEHTENADYWVSGAYNVTNLGPWSRANLTKY